MATRSLFIFKHIHISRICVGCFSNSNIREYIYTSRCVYANNSRYRLSGGTGWRYRLSNDTSVHDTTTHMYIIYIDAYAQTHTQNYKVVITGQVVSYYCKSIHTHLPPSHQVSIHQQKYYRR